MKVGKPEREIIVNGETWGVSIRALFNTYSHPGIDMHWPVINLSRLVDNEWEHADQAFWTGDKLLQDGWNTNPSQEVVQAVYVAIRELLDDRKTTEGFPAGESS